MIQPILTHPLSFKGNKQKLIHKGEDFLKKHSGFEEPLLEIKKVYNSKEDIDLMQRINNEMHKITRDFKEKSVNSRKNAENVILD